MASPAAGRQVSDATDQWVRAGTLSRVCGALAPMERAAHRNELFSLKVCVDDRADVTILPLRGHSPLPDERETAP